MARILDKIWPGGKDGKAYADLPHGARFGTSGGIQADVVLYKTTRPEATFLSARPLLDSKATKSDVHPTHLSLHTRSKYLLESALYVDGGSLYEHIYGVEALEGEGPEATASEATATEATASETAAETDARAC